MIKKTILLGLAGLMALGVFALGGTGAEAGAGSATLIGLDADITGNTSTSIGTVEDCLEANAGDQVTIDAVIDNIPASNPMIAYGVTITLNDAVLTVSSLVDNTGLIASAPGSTAVSASDPTPGPGTDDIFNVAAFDTQVNPPTFPEAEDGDGVLARMVIDINPAAADGIYNVNLTDAGHVDPANTTWAPDATGGVRIAVGSFTCTSTFLQGDVDCSNAVNSVDALKILRFGAGLAYTQTEPCDDINTGDPKMGDVDCSTTVNSVDALKILRFGAGLAYTQTEPCTDIGT
jgi:hypothetical protein